MLFFREMFRFHELKISGFFSKFCSAMAQRGQAATKKIISN
jgi:hypothetical protein